MACRACHHVLSWYQAMYTRAFSYIVGAINNAIEVKSSGKTTVIGVLDIYGSVLL